MKTAEGSALAIAERVVPPIALASLAMILFGVKLLVIGTYGNATPYWDQWDSEARLLYAAFLEGQLGWGDLFAAHNEHRILFPRLLALGLLQVNGIWNPLLQMVVNAALHAAFIGVFAGMLIKVVGQRFLLPVAAFCLVLCALPYGWENTLAGFQSCFYFFLWFTVGAIWLVSVAEPFSARWWVGTGLACGAFFCAASGGLVLATLAAVGVLRYGRGQHKRILEGVAVFTLGALFLGSVICTPRIMTHAPLKAITFTQFLDSFDGYFAWPIKAAVVGALCRNAPGALFTIWMLRAKPPMDDRRWFLLALIVWSFGQSMALAYSRAVGFVPSRYTDMLAVDVLTNFACLIVLWQVFAGRRAVVAVTAAAWVGIVLGCLGASVHKRCPGELEQRRATALAQEVNTRNYVYTGDISHLTDKPHLHVPYPLPGHLAAILDQPTVRTILPRNIGAPMAGTIVARSEGDARIDAGYGADVPSPEGPAWGTHGAQESATILQFSVAFPAPQRAYRIRIPVAGEPEASGIKIEIEQDGKRRPLYTRAASETTWGIATATVRGRPFTVHVTDASLNAWVAVGSPVAVGRWDDRIDRLVTRWDVFVITGAVMAVAVLTLASLAPIPPVR